MLTLTVDGKNIQAQEGMTVLQAALQAGVYIPHLCFHPALPGMQGTKSVDSVYQGSLLIQGTTKNEEPKSCGLCLVKVQGQLALATACTTKCADGMEVSTKGAEIQEQRAHNLAELLAAHPHACLVCAQREGCSREPCSQGIPVAERCCARFGRCELQKIGEYVGIRQSVPRYSYRQLPVVKGQPFFDIDYNLCISCLRCVRVCQDVRGVGALGYVWREGNVVVGTTRPSLKESGCRFCGACAEVCPTGAITDRDIKSAHGQEGAIRCRHACPAEVDVPRYINLIARQKPAEALAVIRESVPFPSVLGHVCTAPCEDVCRRRDLDEPIAIRALKGFAAHNEGSLRKQRPKKAPSTGKSVAVIGAGPAGLTAAFYLAGKGHSVVVFDALPQPGGMMRVGIPEYRLPRHVLDNEIDEIKSMGVAIKANSRVDSLESLLRGGYEAAFVAVGAHQSVKMGVEGEDSPGVMEGMRFLREVNLGQKASVGNRVGVVGGGNAAIDAARTALRLGAKGVTLIYRRTRQEMPASDEEVRGALQEGVKVIFLAAPVKISRNASSLQMKCTWLRLGEPDATGRPRPEVIPDSRWTLEFDTVIAAVGQRPEVPVGFGLRLGRGDTIMADPETLATEQRGIYAGGDVVSGPASVIQAIAQGRRAATAIDRYLGGDGLIGEVLASVEEVNPRLGRWEGGTVQASAQHLKGLSEAVPCFDTGTAVREAERCLRCDLRLHLPRVVLPPDLWSEFTPGNVAAVPEKEGVYQFADKEKNVTYIAGTANLRASLKEEIASRNGPPDQAAYFAFEENPMYTARQNELLQQFLQEHGRLPQGNEDSLF